MKAILSIQIFVIALIVAAFAGWVMNIIEIVHTMGGALNAIFIARCVGVFAAPLGAVLGYF